MVGCAVGKDEGNRLMDGRYVGLLEGRLVGERLGITDGDLGENEGTKEGEADEGRVVRRIGALDSVKLG